MKKYTLYCGLNDKDSKRQEISTLEAAKVVRNACLHHANGATIFEADGIYRHEDGQQVSEKTLRVELLMVNPICAADISRSDPSFSLINCSTVLTLSFPSSSTIRQT